MFSMTSYHKRSSICFALGILLTAGHVSADDDITHRFDNASLGSMPSDYIIGETNGMGNIAVWQVAQFPDAPSGDQALAVTDSSNGPETYNLALVQSTYLVDTEVSVKLKPLSGNSIQGGGVFCRAHDPATFYLAYWNPLDQSFRLDAVVQGVASTLASKRVEADPNRWHEIELEVDGTDIEATFDDEVELEVEDSTLSLAGMVGVCTRGDAATAFDDVEIDVD